MSGDGEVRGDGAMDDAETPGGDGTRGDGDAGGGGGVEPPQASGVEAAKLVILMYLEDDEGCVMRLLGEHRVPVFSRFEMEGMVGPRDEARGAGWYGETLPYRSRMVMTVVPEGRAGALLAAVAGCEGVQDPRHPIRAVQLAVERSTACECEGVGRKGGV